MQLVDANGTAVASYDYDPYGKVISATGTMAEINPIRYRGYVYDTESGLYYLQSRYYDPEMGRFLNADSLISTGQGVLGYNMYAYCSNNPIMGYDPTGHWDFGWQDQAFLGSVVLMVGLALLFAPPTGGASLGGLAISTATISAAGGAAAVTGTIMIGDAVAASFSAANGKPSSRNQMQKQVEKGQAPNEVDRVDGPHIDTENSQNHIHFKDGTAINQDGTLSHKGNGIPNITRAILKWILENGWSAPKLWE